MNENDYNPYDYDYYRYERDPMNEVKYGCITTTLMVMALFLTLLLCMCSCTTTKYVEVPGPSHTDTTYITKWQHDSIFQRDSIHVTEKGDTVTIDRWHTKYVEKVRTDTMQHIVRDTIPKPYPVEVEVPAQLTWWQQTRLHIANILLWALGIFVVIWIVKIVVKKYRP